MDYSIYIPEKQNCRDKNQISGCQRLKQNSELIAKTYEGLYGVMKTWWNGNILLHVDWGGDGGGYTTEHICQNSEKYAPEKGEFCCM